MIVTHQNPDFDAICGVWLLKRFSGLEDKPIEFVNTGNPDPEKLAKAMAVVDTGKQFDPVKLRFDHHHLARERANSTCAAMQIFEFCLRRHPQPGKINYLEPLVELILTGDTGRPEANASRELGIHALLSGFKASYRECGAYADDMDIMKYGFSLLNTLALHLKNQAEAHAELKEKVVYKSDDGLIWAIRHGSSGSSFAAFEKGARLVVFEGQPVEVEGGTTYPIGIMRAGEWQEPHVGDLVGRLLAKWGVPEATWEELKGWYRHEAGFFAGRGTMKAPVFESVNIDLKTLAMEFDAIWNR